eukprot:766800_1
MGNKGSSTVTLCKPVTPFTMFLLTCSFAGMILFVPLLFYGCYRSVKIKSKSLKIMLRITFSMLLIAGIVYPVHQFLGFDWSGQRYCTDFNRIPITFTVAFSSYMISLTCISCVYFIRLSLSFQNSNYALPKFISYTLSFCLCPQFILVFLTVYFNLKAWYTKDVNLGNIAGWSWLLFAILNLSFNLMLLILFLFKLSRMRRTMNVDSIDAVNVIIKPATIYILCLFLAFISTVISYTFGWIRQNMIVDTNELFLVSSTLMCWDIFINLFSVILQFDNSKLFNICCGRCNVCLMLCILNKLSPKTGLSSAELFAAINKDEHVQLRITTTTVTNATSTTSASSTTTELI